MSIARNLAHRAQAAKGTAKQFLGRATGNNRLTTEGRVEQVKGNLKKAGVNLRKAFKR